MNKLAVIACVFLLSAGLSLAQNPIAKDATGKQPPRSQKKTGQPVQGKTQANTGTPAIPVTSTATAGQTTPGAQTEAGVEQQPGGNSDVAHTASATPKRSNLNNAAPHNMAEAGQSPQEANTNAQAAQRAEIEPGHTQGVNGQEGPMDQASGSQGEPAKAGTAAQLPQSDASESHAKKQRKHRTQKKAADQPSAESPH